MLEHKSGNISELREDRAKITMEGLYKVTNALLDGTIPDPALCPLHFLRLDVRKSQPPPKTPIAIMSGTVKAIRT